MCDPSSFPKSTAPTRLEDFLCSDVAVQSFWELFSLHDRNALCLTSKHNYHQVFLHLSNDLSHRTFSNDVIHRMIQPVSGIMVEYGASYSDVNDTINLLPGVGRLQCELVPKQGTTLLYDIKSDVKFTRASVNKEVPSLTVRLGGSARRRRHSFARSNLKVLKGDPGTSQRPFLLPYCHKLQLTGLMKLELKGNGIKGNVCVDLNYLSSCLKHLSLESGNSCEELSNCDLESLVHSFPYLNHLELRGNFVSGDLKSLEKLSCSLKTLVLTECPQVRGQLSDLVCLKLLMNLSLSSRFSFRALKHISGDISSLACLTQLQHVNLRFCLNIDGDLSVLLQLLGLCYLNLVGCCQITSDKPPSPTSVITGWHDSQQLEKEFDHPILVALVHSSSSEEEEELLDLGVNQHQANLQRLGYPSLSVPPGRIKMRRHGVVDVCDGYSYTTKAQWNKLRSWLLDTSEPTEVPPPLY